MAIHLTGWQIPPTSEHDEPPMGIVNDLSPARMLGIIARPLCWRQFSITSCSRLKGQDIPGVEPGDYSGLLSSLGRLTSLQELQLRLYDHIDFHDQQVSQQVAGTSSRCDE